MSTEAGQLQLDGCAEKLAIHPTTLRRYVRVYYQLDQFTPEINEALTPSVQIALLGVKDDAKRLELANRAYLEQLTFDQLEAEVAIARGRAPKQPRPGRVPLSPATKAFRSMKKSVAALQAAKVAEMESEHVKEYTAEVEAWIKLLPGVLAELKALDG